MIISRRYLKSSYALSLPIPDRPRRPYTTLFTKLIPELKKRGVTVEEIDQLVRHNPAEVFRIGVRRF